MRKRLLFLVSLMSFLAAVSYGQTTGSFTGRVVDPAGAVVPSATVSVTNTEKGLSRTTTTNSDGLYTISSLQPGTYDVKVEKPGFASSVRKAVTLLAESTITVDFGLTVASTAEQIEVTTEAPLVETTESQVSGTIQTSEVQNLPMLNRNFTSLVQLVPGARPAPILDTSKVNTGAGIAVGGAEGRNLAFNMDGAENKDYLLGGPAQNISLEGIEEFKLMSHEFGAQYARSGGADLEIATKSGTNSLHGSAFGFGRNQGMTAIDYFTNQSKLPKNSYDREQFGGALGGRIIKDRWFWFGDFERTQQNFVETEPLQAYNEMVLLAQALPSIGLQPAKTITKPLDDNLYLLKTDFQITPNNSLFVRWSQETASSPNDQIGISQISLSSVPIPNLSAPNTDTHNAWSLVGSDNWVINNKSTNQFVFQLNRYYSLHAGLNDNPLTAMVFPSFGTGGGNYLAYVQKKVSLGDNYYRQVGSHNLKIGGSLALFPEFNIPVNLFGPGRTTFVNDPSQILASQQKWLANPAGCSVAACGFYKNGFQTPGAAEVILVGNQPGSFTGPVPPEVTDNTPLGRKDLGFYVQDDWRVAPRLTLNLGVRYDLTLNGFDQPELGNHRDYLALKAVGSPYASKLPSTPTRDIQPRVGFAWDIGGNGKNVLRGGFGLFRDSTLQADIWEAVLHAKPTLRFLNIAYINLNPVLQPQGIPAPPSPISNYVVGVSPFPQGNPADPTSLPAGKGTTGIMLDPTVTDPYTEQSHIGFSRQLTSSTALTVDYTHILGLHEFRIQDINPVEGAWDPNAASYNTCSAAPGYRRYQCAFGKVLGDPKILGSLQDVKTNNRSRYDELIFNVVRRARRVTLQASYTLSYANSYGGITSGLATSATSPPLPQNPDQPFGPGEWGPTITDERHRVVVSSVVNLPAGIQLSPILQAASARPYTLLNGSDPTGNNNGAYRMITNKATGQTVGVSSQRGDPSFDLDLRASKFFNLKSESRRLSLFAEFYNLTNRANFGNVFGHTANTASFEQPIGYLTGLPTSRQLQLGGRFTF